MKYNTKKPGNSQALFIDSNTLFNLWFWEKTKIVRVSNIQKKGFQRVYLFYVGIYHAKQLVKPNLKPNLNQIIIINLW